MMQLQIKTSEDNLNHAKHLIQSAIQSEIQPLKRSLVKTNYF